MLDLDIETLVPSHEAMDEATVSALKQRLHVVLQEPHAHILGFSSLALDAGVSTMLIESLLAHMVQSLCVIADPKVFITHGTLWPVISTFRLYRFLAAAANDPVISRVTQHMGDLLVEAIAVIVIVRRTYGVTFWHACTLDWVSRFTSPMDAMRESWQDLAIHCLNPWYQSFCDAVGWLVLGEEPLHRRSLGDQFGAPFTLAQLVAEPPPLVRALLEMNWWATVSPPDYFAIPVKFRYTDMVEVEDKIDELYARGDSPFTSISIFDGMMHIVLSSLYKFYGAGGCLDEYLLGKDASPAAVTCIEHPPAKLVSWLARLREWRDAQTEFPDRPRTEEASSLPGGPASAPPAIAPIRPLTPFPEDDAMDIDLNASRPGLNLGPSHEKAVAEDPFAEEDQLADDDELAQDDQDLGDHTQPSLQAVNHDSRVARTDGGASSLDVDGNELQNSRPQPTWRPGVRTSR